MIKGSACPLDCYDACEVNYEEESIKAKKEGHTAGFLCSHLNHYEQFETIQNPQYKGKDITLEEALKKLKEIISSTANNEILHYRGSGNFGLMQEVTDHFFASIGANLTDGTLCDGAGEAGIIAGRGTNKNMPLSEIKKSDVIIFWGRNPHTTSSHLLPLLKGKTIIVIDPVKTKIAKMADLHIQLKPHTDLYLAMLITRFLHINDMCDEDFLENYASEFEEYYELTQTIRIKATLENIGVTLGDIGNIIEFVREKKVAIICGVGIQKYKDGADVMRSIDTIGVALGLFAKEGCGVAYLGNSKEYIESPFETKAKRVSKVNTPFDNYKTVFIQGTNPLSQMPDTLRVQNTINKVENLIYFGLYENETSRAADLIIPAKNFLEKNDIRTSYSHNTMTIMSVQKEAKRGVSEYELAQFLCKEFDIELQSETEYIQHFRKFSKEQEDGSLLVNKRETIPYQNGFDSDDGEFVFLEEFESLVTNNEKMHLITPKSPKSLNSQFKREEHVYLHPSLGYEEGEEVELFSINASIILNVKHNEDLREDCVLIYSGTKGVNYLTPSQHSYEGKSAVYQENRIEIKRV